MYKVVIKKGRDMYEKVFNVSYDKNTGLNTNERKMQHQIVMKMYNMVQDLAYLVYELDAILEDDSEVKEIKTLNDNHEAQKTALSVILISGGLLLLYLRKK